MTALMVKEPRPRGRPDTFTQEKADAVCAELAKGISLKATCEKLGLPESTVRGWELSREDFAADSVRARELGCHSMADETLAIADDGRNDWMAANDPDNPGYRANGEYIQRSRLRIDTRLRLLGKWLPRIYGDRVDVNHSGTIDLALRIASARERVPE